MGLEQGDDWTVGRAERAVEGRDGADLTVGEPATGVQTPGLEVGAVRGGRELAVAPLARDPGLAVELALRREAQVAGRDVDHAVAELQLVEELLLPLQQPPVLGVRLLEGGLDE